MNNDFELFEKSKAHTSTKCAHLYGNQIMSNITITNYFYNIFINYLEALIYKIFLVIFIEKKNSNNFYIFHKNKY